MGMEISSRRLQEADSRMQAERKGADRPVDDKDKENFDRAMQESRERDGQGGQEDGRGGSRQDVLSPQALLDSLFGSRMQRSIWKIWSWRSSPPLPAPVMMPEISRRLSGRIPQVRMAAYAGGAHGHGDQFPTFAGSGFPHAGRA